jgi:hypothetical protein
MSQAEQDAFHKQQVKEQRNGVQQEDAGIGATPQDLQRQALGAQQDSQQQHAQQVTPALSWFRTKRSFAMAFPR